MALSASRPPLHLSALPHASAGARKLAYISAVQYVYSTAAIASLCSTVSHGSIGVFSAETLSNALLAG